MLGRTALALALAAVFGANGGQATVTLQTRPDALARPGLQILKMPLDEMHIQWQARVETGGGKFVIQLKSGVSTDVIVLDAERGTARYDAVIQTGYFGGGYELRYRDAAGRESVLATVAVEIARLKNVPTLPPNIHVGPPGALREESRWASPIPTGRTRDLGVALPIAAADSPPTPPPRFC